MENILDIAKTHFEQDFPFVLYCKPNSDEVIGFFQKNDTLYPGDDFTNKGFVFASFDGSKAFLIPENESDRISTIFQNKEVVVSELETDNSVASSKSSFEELVTKGIQAINMNQFKKVVLSRKESIDLADFDSITAFEKLVYLYPNTFVYCFYHPKVGIWLGATPEQLLKAAGSKFETIALAGTQKDKGSNEVLWRNKEQEEQQFVTDYIVEKVKNIASEIKVSKPYSIKAGSVWHIKTDISGDFKSEFGLKNIIQLLHPTPAVCGLPMNESKAFILKNEDYDRTFYTGFLGELNIGEKTDLFVNLRCMEIEVASATSDRSKFAMTKAYLFMGCGITKDSIPEKEWEESVNKSLTMKKMLDFRF
ncbi:isochorismate synthase [Flavobacterium sp.]|jgi:isochorismate synthase|uniref:isochorismate synthase n=1 Tax=Flavobacterium sp. TaxID=239 RepID=UPI0037C12716